MPTLVSSTVRSFGASGDCALRQCHLRSREQVCAAYAGRMWDSRILASRPRTFVLISASAAVIGYSMKTISGRVIGRAVHVVTVILALPCRGTVTRVR